MAKILISWFDFSISHSDLHIAKFDFTISRLASNFYGISAQMGTGTIGTARNGRISGMNGANGAKGWMVRSVVGSGCGDIAGDTGILGALHGAALEEPAIVVFGQLLPVCGGHRHQLL